MDNQLTPVIGKDVIESLTLGMYEDSRFIFREYIQNAADQIDKAVRENLLSSIDDGEVHIHIDEGNRRISIEDNATGISTDQVRPILQNIAQSTKQRGVDEGFRGIGRLGGLAYCEKLIFETSYFGENTKSRLIWNAAQLKETINNRSDKEDAAHVIQAITSFETSDETPDAHYFNVILEGVTNDDLLGVREIEEYLSMVAPLPYPTRFIYKSEIYKDLASSAFTLDEYKIYLNTEQLFKGYSTSIYKGDSENKRKDDEVIDIQFFKEYASDGELLYWGWYGVTEKLQSLNEVNIARGFRLRKSNIQVGDEYTLLKFQRDRRFQFYFIAEVHGAHRDLIPNSRRDYFTENNICQEFEQKLKKFFYEDIYRLCHTASDGRSAVKKIEEFQLTEEEFKRKQETVGFDDKQDFEELKERFEKKKIEAIKAQKKIEKIKQDAANNSPIGKILNRATTRIPSTNIEGTELASVLKPKFRANNLSSLTKEHQKLIGKIYSIIRNVLDPKTAESLIQKIEEELR